MKIGHIISSIPLPFDIVPNITLTRTETENIRNFGYDSFIGALPIAGGVVKTFHEGIAESFFVVATIHIGASAMHACRA